jgi:hypothetical protein
MTNAVISAVEAMAEKEGQLLIKGGVPLFKWRPNASVKDFLEEDVESAGEYESFAEDIFDPTEPDDDVVEEPDDYDDIDPPKMMILASGMTMKLMIPPFVSLIPMFLGLMDLIPTPTKAPSQTTIPETKIPETMLPTQTWSLMQTKIRVPTGAILGATEADPTATNLITTQRDSMNIFEPLDASTLTASQKREALRTVNLMKEKRSGKFRGRTCADGRSQRSKYTKEETTSPTVSTDALMISLMTIDAKERRDVAMAEVEGGYLHADMEEFVLLKLVGEAVDIMCQVNPKCQKFVVIENGKKVLYLQLLKALYGCVQSALLWYGLFTNTLVRMGFKVNLYDLCVANS